MTAPTVPPSALPAYVSRVAPGELAAARAMLGAAAARELDSLDNAPGGPSSASDASAPADPLTAALPPLRDALAALDAARVAFDANDSAGRKAEAEVAAAEAAWTGAQTEDNWRTVEAYQRDARQALLRARPLLFAIERAEDSFRARLRSALAAERSALAARFAEQLAPALAEYTAAALELQGMARQIDAARLAFRHEAMALWTRGLETGTMHAAAGVPPELVIALDGFGLASATVRAAALALPASRRPGGLGESSPMVLLQRGGGDAGIGAESDAINAAVKLLAPALAAASEAFDAAPEGEPPPPSMLRVVNLHTATVAKIPPGAEGTIANGAGALALIRGGLLRVVDAPAEQPAAAPAPSAEQPAADSNDPSNPNDSNPNG